MDFPAACTPTTSQTPSVTSTSLANGRRGACPQYAAGRGAYSRRGNMVQWADSVTATFDSSAERGISSSQMSCPRTFCEQQMMRSISFGALSLPMKDPVVLAPICGSDLAPSCPGAMHRCADREHSTSLTSSWLPWSSTMRSTTSRWRPPSHLGVTCQAVPTSTGTVLMRILRRPSRCSLESSSAIRALQARAIFWIWPRSHIQHQRLFAERGTRVLQQSSGHPTLLDPPLELGPGVEVHGGRGDLVLSHYLTGHNKGGNTSAQVRRTIYFRLAVSGHAERWEQTFRDPLIEFTSVRHALGDV